jgi:hypothetical protein
MCVCVRGPHMLILRILIEYTWFFDFHHGVIVSRAIKNIRVIALLYLLIVNRKCVQFVFTNTDCSG